MQTGKRLSFSLQKVSKHKSTIRIKTKKYINMYEEGVSLSHTIYNLL